MIVFVKYKCSGTNVIKLKFKKGKDFFNNLGCFSNLRLLGVNSVQKIVFFPRFASIAVNFFRGWEENLGSNNFNVFFWLMKKLAAMPEKRQENSPFGHNLHWKTSNCNET